MPKDAPQPPDDPWEPDAPPLTEADLRTSRLVVVHYWARRNRIDRAMDDVLRRLRGRYAHRVCFRSCEVDLPDNKPFIHQLGNVPALGCFVEGRRKETVVGLCTEDQLRKKLDEWVERGQRGAGPTIDAASRRGGARQWLLLFKFVAVGCYLGGLGATGVVWLSSGFGSLDPADARRAWTTDAVRSLSLFWTVPALLTAIAAGVALAVRDPRLLRARWLRVKLVCLVVLVPAAHFFLSSRLAVLREAQRFGARDAAAERMFAWGLLGTIVVSLWVVALGRLRPRMGRGEDPSVPLPPG